MLVAALGSTVLGFALLVVALITGTLWLAVGCVVVCVVGAGFLIADTVGIRFPFHRRGGSDQVAAPTGAPVRQDQPAHSGDAVAYADEHADPGESGGREESAGEQAADTVADLNDRQWSDNSDNR